MDKRKAVYDALDALSKGNPGNGLFKPHFSAATVAERALCSVTTARKYLEELSRCRGYSRYRFRDGLIGYRKETGQCGM